MANPLHARQEFGDQKFRLVRYCLKATSRFREYMPTVVLQDSKESLCRLGPVFAGHRLALSPDYESVSSIDDEGQLLPPPAEELGFPLLPTEGELHKGTVVPASARPLAPTVAYITPTWRWEDSSTGKHFRSIRHGEGLRIFLKRPWFSSGEGELLGVVVLPLPKNGGEETCSLQDLTGEQAQYVSQWGIDPSVESIAPREPLRLESFPLRAKLDQPFFVPDLGRPAMIASHRVQYDFERRLWYCDVLFDARETYYPFVRLALVRCQPNAIDDCGVSPVVTADFSQFSPTREILLTRNGSKFSVQMFGSAPRLGAASAKALMAEESQTERLKELGYDEGRNRVEVVVQEIGSKFETDLVWRDVTPPQAVSGITNPKHGATINLDGLGIVRGSGANTGSSHASCATSAANNRRDSRGRR